jgi:hypothetical protein
MLKEKLFEYQGLFYIVIFNLLPVYYVLTGRADVFTIVFLYWMESIIVGIFTVLRMAFAAGQGSALKTKISIIPFFVLHYFAFVLGQLIFVFAFMGDFISARTFVSANFKMLFWAIFLSHTLAFVGDYIGRREYLYASPQMEMFRPYGRIIVQQLVVLGGGYLLMTYQLKTAVVFLAILVAAKTIADIIGYLFSRPRSK